MSETAAPQRGFAAFRHREFTIYWMVFIGASNELGMFESGVSPG